MNTSNSSHISQASVTALTEKLENAQNTDSNNKFDQIKSILSKLPIGGGDDDEMGQAEQMQSQSKAYNFNPDDVAPPEVQQQLWALLKWRDNVYRGILKKIEMVPGLEDMLDELSNALNEFVYTTLAPYLTPILTQATGALGEGSKAVIDTEEQYEVFDNPRASDPTHSLLSKDHFGLILNEPAGKIAQIVVTNSVGLIVKAWGDDGINPDDVIDRILEAFHHPYYAEGNSKIQNHMFEAMEQWFRDLGSEESEQTIEALTKESVREGKNKRLSEEQQQDVEPGYGRRPGQSQGHSHSGGGSGYSGGNDNSYGQQRRQEESVQQSFPGYQQESYGSRRDDNDSYSGGGGYGGSGRNDNSDSYGQGRRQEEYGGGGYQQEESYSSRRNEYEGGGGGYNPSYSSEEPRREYDDGERRGGGYGGNDREDRGGYNPSYSSENRRGEYDGGEQRYGGDREDRGGYNTSYEQPRREERREYGGYGGEREERGYGGEREERGYGGEREERRDYGGYGGGRDERQESGGSGYGGGEERRDYGSGYDREERRGDYRESDDTFGAERMNIRDDQSGGGEDYERRSRNEYNDY
ncbi:hypothetical protein D9758_000522 [Tetrapyrgos nigripes]|uniref:Uncharacterized protein n=1 Tax=Tetrapyrgos nigripes TaxID=182062 RepID=A0A8H5LZH1_9AGAR|nr:hypothetical protein D9758_000522 [Tetrapyrgos nigripes]